MITVFHLSDFHIMRRRDSAENRNAQVLVDHLLTRYGHHAKHAMFAVMTGDLVHSITVEHYQNLRKLVLDPLRERFNVIVVPGNHDYARVGHFHHPTGPALFHEFAENRTYPLLEPSVEKVPAGEAKVRFVALDTADKEDEVFSANGILDEGQVYELRRILAHHKHEFLVLCMHHHPFNQNPFTAFREYRRFLRLIRHKRNVIVLFGHKHRSQPFFDREGVPLMLASSKVTRAKRGVLSFRVLRMNTRAEGFGRGLTGIEFHTEEIPAAPARRTRRRSSSR